MRLVWRLRMAALGIEHVGITVPDICTATTFFERAFGAQLVYDGLKRSDAPLRGPKLERSLGLAPKTSVRAARLIRLGDGANLELFEMDSDQQRPPPRPSDFGVQHIAVFTDDIQADAERFVSAGGILLDSPANSLFPLEQAPDNRSCYGRTPWGQIIELISYTHLPYERETRLRRWHPRWPAEAPAPRSDQK